MIWMSVYQKDAFNALYTGKKRLVSMHGSSPSVYLFFCPTPLKEDKKYAKEHESKNCFQWFLALRSKSAKFPRGILFLWQHKSAFAEFMSEFQIPSMYLQRCSFNKASSFNFFANSISPLIKGVLKVLSSNGRFFRSRSFFPLFLRWLLYLLSPTL